MPIDKTLPEPIYREAEHNLSEAVVMIEFTLISVIAGLTLFPLIDYSVPLVRELRVEHWLYILTDLLLVMVFWTIVIGHVLAFVAWPLDIAHNLLYLVLFPLLGLQIHFLGDVQAWFGLLVVVSGVAACTSIYDLYLVRSRIRGAGARGVALYTLAAQRQQVLVYIALLSAIFSAVGVILVLVFPDFFLRQGGHVLLIGVSFVWMLLVLGREMRTFSDLRDRILARSAEDLAAERESSGLQERSAQAAGTPAE